MSFYIIMGYSDPQQWLQTTEESTITIFHGLQHTLIRLVILPRKRGWGGGDLWPT